MKTNLSCIAPSQSFRLPAIIQLWSVVAMLFMPVCIASDGVDGCSSDALSSSNDRVLLQLGSKTSATPDYAMDRAFMLHERRGPRDAGDGDGSADVGETAPLSETGYQSVVKLCCPLQMIAFIKRVIANEGLHICDKGGVSGLVIWFDCPKDKQSYNVLVQKLKEGTEGACPYLRSGSECKPRLDSCPSFPDATLPPCGGDVEEKQKMPREETTDVGKKMKEPAAETAVVGEKKKKAFGEKKKKAVGETTVHYQATVHYVHLEAHGACSVKGPFEHERCHCKDQAVTFCRTKCNLDDNCKGYVKALSRGCDIATTSDCDTKCKKLNAGTVGELVTPGRWSSGPAKDHYGGCWKKKKKISEEEEKDSGEDY